MLALSIASTLACQKEEATASETEVADPEAAISVSQEDGQSETECRLFCNYEGPTDLDADLSTDPTEGAEQAAADPGGQEKESCFQRCMDRKRAQQSAALGIGASVGGDVPVAPTGPAPAATPVMVLLIRHPEAGLDGQTLRYSLLDPDSEQHQEARCRTECAADRDCAGWTLIRAGQYKVEKAQCYLMSRATRWMPSPCCVSGVKTALPAPSPVPTGAVRQH